MNRPDYRKILTTNIRMRREAMGLSLAETAQRSGIPVKMLETLEQGVIPPEMLITDVFYLAQIFHCETFELFK
jgi:transcriptional regulator with XRE-family HTH domain